VSSPEEILDVIDEGKSNRHVAVTSKWGYKRLVSLEGCLPLFCVLLGASEQGRTVSTRRRTSPCL
jgi:hypothetical protein